MSESIYILTVLFFAYVIYQVKGDEIKAILKKINTPTQTGLPK